ncbi:unnamed protein product [Ixodes pacificus]
MYPTFSGSFQSSGSDNVGLSGSNKESSSKVWELAASAMVLGFLPPVL